MAGEHRILLVSISCIAADGVIQKGWNGLQVPVAAACVREIKSAKLPNPACNADDSGICEGRIWLAFAGFFGII